MSATNRHDRPFSVGIVGAGFGGLGMGIRLRRAGVANFTIFERGESVGGVWRANTYPGAACDVPSHVYSFSFARGHQWSKRFATQPDIRRYLEEITDEYGLRPQIQLNADVASAAFDPEAGGWSVTTGDGEEHRFDILVTACGQLANPAIPEPPGIEGFKGRVFHSAEWDHDHDLTGRRVAVIGTGASAIQFVPAIAEQTDRLHIYQRSAPWILPKPDRDYHDWERRLFKGFPPRVAASRAGVFALIEAGTYGFTGTDWVMRILQRVADRYRSNEIADSRLRGLATPEYEMGCKRVLISNDWYATIQRPDVELINGGVKRITAAGVVGSDGIERPADTIIWGTGFRSHDFVAPMKITGLGGRELNEVWAARPEAYLGTTVSGFPNLFVMYGPNTNHGLGSVPHTLECQFNYVIDAIDRMRANGIRYIDLRPEVQSAWREEIATRSKSTKWVAGGCANWYINGDGVNTNNWPGAWLEYRRRTRRLSPGDYRATL